MNPLTLADDVAALESCLDAPSTPQAEALAAALATSLCTVSASSTRELREVAVHGLMVASHQFYRTGSTARATELLRAATVLAGDLDAALRIRLLLRCGEIELLNYDVGAALGHTSVALDVARRAGRTVDEVQAWVTYGMALDWAGLYQQADAHWAHALRVVGGTGDARLRGNIWALRCPLGFRLRAGEERAAEEACRQALALRPGDACALPRLDGVHGAVQLGGAGHPARPRRRGPRPPRARGVLSQPGRAPAMAHRGAARHGRGAHPQRARRPRGARSAPPARSAPRPSPT